MQQIYKKEKEGWKCDKQDKETKTEEKIWWPRQGDKEDNKEENRKTKTIDRKYSRENKGTMEKIEERVERKITDKGIKKRKGQKEKMDAKK